MKKSNVFGSIVLSALFTLSLAHAEGTSGSAGTAGTDTSNDTMTTDQSGTTSGMQQPGTIDDTQQPGINEPGVAPSPMMGDTTTRTEESTTSTTTSKSTAMMEDQLKHAKTCTSEATGKTYKRGQTGFKSCQQELRRKQEQMSGMTGEDMSGPSDTGSTSDSMMPDSSTSSNTGTGSGSSR
ncbi:MAG: hypothetical protein NDJ90_08000 [Oligoflexia bacterium]|nr:hypothetical protein [Oligoflexia bacterium]